MMSEPEGSIQMNQTKKWIVLSIVLVFITGTLAGTLVGIVIGRKTFLPVAGPPFREPSMDRPMPPEQLREGFVQRLTEELSLTPDQVKEIRKIMESNEKELMSFRDDMRDKMLKMRQKMSSQIKGILNNEQRKKFEELEKRRNERFDRSEFGPPDGRQGEGLGPPGPPPGSQGRFEHFRDREATDRPFRP